MNDDIETQPENIIPDDDGEENGEPETLVVEVPPEVDEDATEIETTGTAQSADISGGLHKATAGFFVDSFQKESEQAAESSEEIPPEVTEESPDLETEIEPIDEGEDDETAIAAAALAVAASTEDEDFDSEALEEETDLLDEDEYTEPVMEEEALPEPEPEMVAQPTDMMDEQVSTESQGGLGAAIAGTTPAQRLVLAILFLLDIMAIVFAYLYITEQVTF